MPKSSIAALILAAGSSSRMGVAKQLLPFRESTLLDRVIHTVKSTNVDEVYCVLGANADIITPQIQKQGITILYNSDYEKGLSSSIICGIEQIKRDNYDAVLIVLGDQPLMETIYFNKLISAFNSDQKTIIATKYKDNFGVPVVISKDYFSDLLQLQGDRGAKTFLNMQRHNIIALKSDTLLDIDNEDDYNKLINRFEKK